MHHDYDILEDDEVIDNFSGTREEFDAYFDEHYSGGDFEFVEY